MIIDSLFAVTCTLINKNHEVPEAVTVGRNGKARKYNKEKIIEIASKVVGDPSPENYATEAQQQALMLRAMIVIQKRRSLKKLGWLCRRGKKCGKQLFVEGLKIIDIREATCNCSGMVKGYLQKFAAGGRPRNFVRHSEGFLSQVTNTDLVITQTEPECIALQHYFAGRGIVTVVAYSEQVSTLTTQAAEEWSKPFVGTGV